MEPFDSTPRSHDRNLTAVRYSSHRLRILLAHRRAVRHRLMVSRLVHRLIDRLMVSGLVSRLVHRLVLLLLPLSGISDRPTNRRSHESGGYLKILLLNLLLLLLMPTLLLDKLIIPFHLLQLPHSQVVSSLSLGVDRVDQLCVGDVRIVTDRSPCVRQSA